MNAFILSTAQKHIVTIRRFGTRIKAMRVLVGRRSRLIGMFHTMKALGKVACLFVSVREESEYLRAISLATYWQCSRIIITRTQSPVAFDVGHIICMLAWPAILAKVSGTGSPLEEPAYLAYFSADRRRRLMLRG